MRLIGVEILAHFREVCLAGCAAHALRPARAALWSGRSDLWARSSRLFQTLTGLFAQSAWGFASMLGDEPREIGRTAKAKGGRNVAHREVG